MGKSADAFRTISEVADWLETPAHVLRFWESKFSGEAGEARRWSAVLPSRRHEASGRHQETAA